MHNIELFTLDQFDHAIPLLTAYCFKPFQAHTREFGETALRDYFVASVKERIKSVDARALCAYQGGDMIGLLIWSPLKLESQYLGYSAARIDYLVATGDYDTQRCVKDDLLTGLVSRCKADQFRHVNVRVDAWDMSSVRTLENAGFILVDGLITYSRDLRRGSWALSKDIDYQLRPAIAADLPALRELAGSAFSFDRLHADPSVSKSAADQIHAAWVENSLHGNDQVLVVADEDGLLGYSVFKTNHATRPYFGQPLGVWVIAAAAARARERGVAKSLCLWMFDWHRDQGVNIVEGGTQLANVASARLHESCGFRVSSTSLSFSKWIEATL